MAVPRELSFLKQGSGSQTLEIYLDLLCPFSGKQARGLTEHVLPLVQQGGEYEKDLSVVTWIYPQPFHYASPIPSECALVFGNQHPELFWRYILAIFAVQERYYNVPAASLTPDQIRDQLCEVALEVLEKEGKLGQGPKSAAYGQLRDAFAVKEKEGGKNKGTGMFDAQKHIIKIGRQNSIHVTPTALFDGLIENSVSSSWGKDEWEKFLSAKLGK